ncbi:TetR/AcrR family transcriptional regulator C-terminal domain-containing protein [Miltoncostaea marina]|uniref:TetR/AcrR family transcriptional regulator C-terminal domain-containing protein n=1 Tax=Miltoncostaea marina TaxID=2843215 RepID=UPI0024847D9B|nr:TetR/AcrR family transcriptional regulator C-terminal domain-containing protein [Miltoncostaea marina]
MSTGGPRRPLSAGRIVRAAMDLIDERGLEALTMRRLGAELGVEAMSLYKHVRGKEAILDGVRELLLAELAASGPAAGRDWREALLRFARAYRALARAHPGSFALLAAAPERAYVAGSDVAEAAIARLLEGGFERAAAIRALRTVIRYVIGASMVERAAGDEAAPVGADELAALSTARPLVGELVGSLGTPGDEALFEFGLAALVAGFERLRGG